MTIHDERLLTAITSIAAGGMHSVDECLSIGHLALQAKDIPGDYVEFGCAAGRTARLIAHLCPKKRIYLADTFKGLPERLPIDGDSPHFAPGAIACDEKVPRDLFQASNLDWPTTIKGQFKDVERILFPNQVALALIDCDLNQSVTDSLNIVFPLLSTGAIVMIHDYAHPLLPGVKPAVDAFMYREGVLKPNTSGVSTVSPLVAVNTHGYPRLHYFTRL
jgi:O-methyltransferase